ncbi:hypothetical protein [Bacillus subtilis]|uniref:hypothetical protein n=1 Tax=Bacillus subtilis TaxID=1423 RepID=UPI00208DCBAA|nr:hypothetical protein [Bacillus subtilis]
MAHSKVYPHHSVFKNAVLSDSRVQIFCSIFQIFEVIKISEQTNINTSENRRFLYEYLVKQAVREHDLSESDAEEFAAHLMKKRSDDLFTYHGLAWELGQKNLEFFCLFFLQDTFRAPGTSEIAPIHKQIWEDIENMLLHNTHDKQVYVLPRGTGKSAFANLPTVAFSVANKLRIFTLVCSSTGELADKFIKQIKEVFVDNIYLQSCYGKLLDPANKKYICNSSQLEFTNGTMVESISSKTDMRGRKYGNTRIELAILDDYQNNDDCATDANREKKWDRFASDVNFALQKPQFDEKGKLIRQGGIMIGCGTIQHPECFYSRLLNLPTWKVRKEKGILVDDIDEMFNSGLWADFKEILSDSKNENRLLHAKEFYYQHEDEMKFPILWESYWNPLDMALAYYENPVAYNQEVQGLITSTGQKKFKTIITESAEKIESHDFTKTMLSIDPAGTRNKQKKKKDFYAFVVGSVSDMNIKYVRKGTVFKGEYEDYMDYTLKLLKEYPDISFVNIEKNVYNGADVIQLQELVRNDPELKGRKIEWLNNAVTKNKDDRINTIVGDVNMGRIIFNEEDEEAIQQLRDFAGADFSAYDDFPDAVAEWSKRINEVEDIGYVTSIPKGWFF